jgi:glycosyltransferase involved in cell wall biosynthesis
MKILMLLIGHDFPPDIRVEKEARALWADGHRITLVCENRKNRDRHGGWKRMKIIRLPRLPVWLRRINTAALFVFMRSPLWEHKIKRIVQQEMPDVLHVHDLPFIGPTLRVAKQFGLPVVADLHENYPAWVRIRRTEAGLNLIERLAFNPERFERYERHVVPRCDFVITVVEEAAQRIEKLGVPPDKIFVVGNTEDITAVRNYRTQTIHLPDSDLVLLYVGSFGAHRGLDTCIRGMPEILREIPTARLVIVGDGPSRPTLEQMSRRLGVQPFVLFEGRQPFAKVYAYIAASDVCLVPHVANPHTNATMPHKLFQYMYMKRPVIVSTAIPLARVVRETGCGLVFESENPSDFAGCALQLRDPTLRRNLGQNGHQAVIQQYNWQRDAQRLRDLYQTLQN